MRRMLWIAGAFFAVVIAVGLFSDGPDRPTQPPRAGASQTDHGVLQRDAEMTQRMGVAGTPGAMERGAVVDDQLRHSHSAGFVTDLEAHQQEIDRMLARPDQ